MSWNEWIIEEIITKAVFHMTSLLSIIGRLTVNWLLCLSQSALKYESLIQHPTHCYSALITNLFRFLQHCSHYHIVFTYQLENCEHWFFFMPWNYASCLIGALALTLISPLLLSDLLIQKRSEFQIKDFHGADNKTCLTLAAIIGLLFTADFPLAHN